MFDSNNHFALKRHFPFILLFNMRLHSKLIWSFYMLLPSEERMEVHSPRLCKTDMLLGQVWKNTDKTLFFHKNANSIEVLLSQGWLGRFYFYQLSAELPSFSASAKRPFRNAGCKRKRLWHSFCFSEPEASSYLVQPSVLSTSTVIHLSRSQVMISHSDIYISSFSANTAELQ